MLRKVRVSEPKRGDSSIDVRFAPPGGGAWSLVFVRVHFIDDGSTASSADMTISVSEDIVRDAVQTHQTLLARIVGAGVANDVFFRVKEEDLPHYFIRAGWGIQIDWISPDPGDIFWGMEIGYVLAEEDGGPDVD